MLDAIRTFLRENFAVGQDEKDTEDVLHLSAALLFVEVMYADHEVDERERAVVKNVLQQTFFLQPAEAEAILKEAEQQASKVISLHELASTLNQHLSIAEKITLVEQIWKIIMADNEIDRYEEHLARKIADLLHLRHSEYIQAKLRVVK